MGPPGFFLISPGDGFRQERKKKKEEKGQVGEGKNVLPILFQLFNIKFPRTPIQKGGGKRGRREKGRYLRYGYGRMVLYW